MTKFKLNVVLPERLIQDVNIILTTNGYDLKKKSLWVSEAIENLLKMEGFAEMVKINNEMAGKGKNDSIQVDRGLKLKIEEAILVVRRSFPEVEGVQSKIVRTAILQRILNTQVT